MTLKKKKFTKKKKRELSFHKTVEDLKVFREIIVEKCKQNNWKHQESQQSEIQSMFKNRHTIWGYLFIYL